MKSLPRYPEYLKTPDGMLAWDPSKTGPVKGMAFRATLGGRAITDASLLILLERYAPDGF